MNMSHGLIERSIVRQFICSLIGQGFSLRLYDGEEYALDGRATSDANEAIAAAFDTDCLSIGFYKGAVPVQRIGAVEFIFGNGIDTVHDYTASPEAEQALAPALKWVEDLDERSDLFGIVRLPDAGVLKGWEYAETSHD